MKSKYLKLTLTLGWLLAACSAVEAQFATDTVYLQDKAFPVTNIGFAKQPVRVVTSSVATVSGNDLTKNFNTNIGNALYGRLAGLTVNQGGNEPGVSSPSLFVRGKNTYGPGSNLLVVIDGFLGDYTQLVPQEIEQISVLKDAAATAIYGSRGANGVLLVTTKRGNNRPLTINFSSQWGFSQATSLPKFLDSYNYATLYNEALANDGKAPLYTNADLQAYQSGSNPFFKPNINWYNEVLRKSAPVANYNLNFRGGNEYVKYFVMLNAITSEGLFKKFGDMDDESRNSSYSRYNFRSNIDVNLTSRISASLLLGGTVEDKANPSSLTTGGTFNLLSLLPPNAFPVRNADGTFARNSVYGNPYANLLKTGYAESNGRTIQSSFRLNYDMSMITPGLSGSGAISLNNYFSSGSNRTKTLQTSIQTLSPLGDTVKTNNGQTTSLSGSEPNLGQYRNFAIQAFLNYNRNFGKHGIIAMAVFNTDNSTVDKGNIYSATDAANLSLSYKTNSVGTRVTYVNSDKYIAEFTGSYMGSENYAEGSRYGFFPALSLGWIASSEDFLKHNQQISFLKIRASYGKAGNDEIGGNRFMYAQRYPYNAGYYLGTGNTAVAGLSEGRIANPDVTWESEKKANVGIDATFFNHLDVSLDVFNQDRYDILTVANRTVPLVLGYTDLPFINQGKVNNKGFEAVVRYRNAEKNALKFFAEANVFYAKNKIVFNAQAIQVNKGLVSEGNAVDQPFGLRALGLFTSDADIAASAKPLGLVIRPGDVKYEDIGGPLGKPDGIIDGNDVQPIGNTNLPTFTAGLHTGVQYKGFDLDMVVQGVTGKSTYLGAAQFRPFQNNGQAGEIALERWTPQAAGSAAFPRLSADNNLNNYRFSSFYQRNGSFIKLRSAEVGYALPGAWVAKAKLQMARIFVNGTNLFSIDHIKYGDPEALSGYPALRTITFGARIQF